MKAVLTFITFALVASCSVEPRECTRQEDCFAGEQCVENLCVDQIVEQGCVRNQDCGSNEFCEKSSQTCECVEAATRCGGDCVMESPDFCGESCTRCPDPDHGDPVCVEGRCGVQCDPGFSECAECDNRCVECRTDLDCPDGLPKCDNGTCGICISSETCDGRTNSICDSGACVQCTDSESQACLGNSCNPATGKCTDTPLRSRDTCEPCVSDTECFSGHWCVEMSFAGSKLPGGFCLLESDDDRCSRPFSFRELRRTLSNPSMQPICTVRETLVSCAAFLDHGHTCDRDADCGTEGFSDAQCRTMDGTARCTYQCREDVDCPGGGPFCINELYCSNE